MGVSEHRVMWESITFSKSSRVKQVHPQLESSVGITNTIIVHTQELILDQQASSDFCLPVQSCQRKTDHLALLSGRTTGPVSAWTQAKVLIKVLALKEFREHEPHDCAPKGNVMIVVDFSTLSSITLPSPVRTSRRREVGREIGSAFKL